MRDALDAIVVLAIIIGLCFCFHIHNENKRKKQVYEKIENNITEVYFNEDSLKELIVSEGNLSAYLMLRSKANVHQKRCDFMDLLPYSIYMANKYHYADIYYDVYRCLDFFQTFSEFDSLDSETKELAIMYLKKSSERRYGVAKLQLQRLKIE